MNSPRTNRRRVGVPITYQFSVRYLVHTGLLRRLAELVDPVVFLGWDDPTLARQIESAGAEVRTLPEARFGTTYLRHRRLVEALHDRRLRSPSGPIDRRRRDLIYGRATRVRRRARWEALSLLSSLPAAPDRILAREQQLVVEDTTLAEADQAVAEARLDAVLSVTPYHRAEELLLRTAERRGLGLVTSIISFDNPTTRGWISTPFDRYLVWNEHNRQELLRGYPRVSSDQITVTGAPQFDFYADPRWRWSEEEWRAELGLPGDRPVILYGGGPVEIVPHEPHLLRQLDDAIDRGDVAGEPVVLFRRHPMEPPERWRPVVASCRHVVADDPWAVRAAGVQRSSAEPRDIERLVSTLAHSQVHVNTSSTMTVDGAFFDRPQVGPAYDDRPGRPADRQVRELYQREHWLPIARSGGMVIARNRKQLVSGVTDGLRRPAELSAGRARMVREIVTFTDGRATERVVAGVADALGVGTSHPSVGPADGSVASPSGTRTAGPRARR